MHILIGERTGRTDLSALRDARYPLEVTAHNRMTIRLSLPEAGWRLEPLSEQTATFASFDLLQRTVSSLEQLAVIQRAPALVQLDIQTEAPALPAAPDPEPVPVPVPVQTDAAEDADDAADPLPRAIRRAKPIKAAVEAAS